MFTDVNAMTRVAHIILRGSKSLHVVQTFHSATVGLGIMKPVVDFQRLMFCCLDDVAGPVRLLRTLLTQVLFKENDPYQ